MKMTELMERRSSARPAGEVQFSGTEETSWADVGKALADFVAAYGTEDEEGVEVSELSEETREAIAARTLLGEADAETSADLISVPVVNPSTDNLNRGALNAARAAAGGARGADLPDPDGLMSVTAQLLEEEFDVEVGEAMDFRTQVEQEDLSFEDVRQMLHSALVDLERPGDQWLHINAVFDDRVVYSIQDGPMWQREYSMSSDGEVEFGDRVEVQRRTTFEPVGESEAEVKESVETMKSDLIETFATGQAFQEAHVDRRTNTIQNVALLGRRSRNGRIYSDRSMKEAADLYPGTKFFIDHPTKSEEKERSGVRSVHDLAGRVLNARVVGEQVRGDLELLDREPTKSLVFSLAEQMPEVVGNSHRAAGEVRVNEEGIQVVESIDKVFGMELVTEPATTDGLLESIEGKKNPQGEADMEISEMTLAQLKEKRPDLVRSLMSEQEREEHVQNLQEQVEALEPKAETAEELEEQNSELQEQVESLTEERDALKEENEEFKEQIRIQEREDLIRSKLEEHDLGKDEVPKVFFEQMMNAEDEEAVDDLIEAIDQIADRPSGSSRRRGPKLFERDPDEVVVREGKNGKKPLTDEKISEAYDRMFA